MKKLVITIYIFLMPLLAFSGGSKEESKATDAHFALGTVCTITLYGSIDEEVFDNAFDLVDEIESKMSVSKKGSEVALINRSAGKAPVTVSADTFNVLQQSLEYMPLGDGKFDITIQPLVELWGIGTELARIPEEAEIENAVSLVGYSDIILNTAESSVLLKRAGMAVDLGGIAKGYAADQVRNYLVELGYERGIINFGGNLVTFGVKPSGDPWVIGIQDPYNTRGKPMATVDIFEGAVVTSGIYERYFERDGVKYHHILDPDTGYPIDNELASISIVGPESITADVFSTIIYALGITKGIELLESLPSFDGIFVTKTKEVIVTSGIRETISLTNPEYFLKS